MKQWVLQLAAVCLFWPATIAVAEPVTLASLVALAQKEPDTVFVGQSGLQVVVDVKQNLLWVFDETGAFEEIFALRGKDQTLNLLSDGELVAQLDVTSLVDWSPSEVKVELPKSRRIFQGIARATLQTDAGTLLPAGSVFDDGFSVRRPDDHLLIWRPSGDAKSIWLRDLTTGEIDSVAIEDLGKALGMGE